MERETTTTTVAVPVTFYDDHVSRDLPAGVEISRTKTKVTVQLTAEEFEDLLTDADYYSTEWKFMGREFFGLGRSAQATVKALRPTG